MNKIVKIFKNYLTIYTCIIFIILISSTVLPVVNIYAAGEISNQISNKNDCFGFVIPLPSSEIISNVPEVQYSTMNLINDLLRLEISVYWTKNKTIFETKKITEDLYYKNEVFEPGTFIVPFSGNELIDSKIISIVNDYNYSHELHKNETRMVNLSMILQPINLEESYKLIEPKIAYYYGDGVYSRSLDWYVYTLFKSGFLTNEFLYDDEIIEKLDYDNYNVFIWPGGEIIEDINSDIDIFTRVSKQNKIRDFVSDGGGYVGSCYGAFAASSGIRFLPLTLINYYYPMMPSIGYLSIQDCTTALAISCTFNISVSEVEHPVTYGADKILYNSQLRGGAVYTWLGKNTKSLATVREVNTTIWTHWFRDLFNANNTISNKIIDLWIKFTNQKTVWTTSEYNKGKVVTFGDHPELGHITLKRIVHNAVFYVSSDLLKNKYFDKSYSIAYIESKKNESNNLEIKELNSEIFNDIYQDINTSLNIFNGYNNISNDLINTIWNMIDNNEMNFSFAIQIYVSGLWEFFSSINRSMNYLYNTLNEDNTINYLKKLDNIYNMLEIDANSLIINNLIKKLKDYISHKLDQIIDINNQIIIELNKLEKNIDNYHNSDLQNETILIICNNLWEYSKSINKNISYIFFESLKTLRETWYNYESIF